MLSKTGYRFRKSLILEPDLTHAEWAEENVILKGTSVSPYPGRLNLSRSPQHRKVFEAFDDPKKRGIYLKWASQTAKTLALTIPMAKKLDTEPSYIHWIYPVKDKVSDLVRIKLDPTLKSIPKVWQKLEDFKAEEKIREKRTIKEIAGGGLYVTGTTANDLKSISVPLTIADEVGEMDKGVVAEAEERQKSYTKAFPRTIAASTIVHPKDEIVTLYDSSECTLDYRIICPECGNSIDSSSKTLILPTEDDFKLEDENGTDSEYISYLTENVHIKCNHCTRKIYEKERESLLYDGKGTTWEVLSGDFDTARTVGFSMSSVCAWVVTLESIALAWYKAGDDYEKLDKFYRGWLNEFYQPKLESTSDAMELIKLATDDKERIIPDDTVALYMGVDTQKDHFWGAIVAYRAGKRPHVVYASKFDTFKEVYEEFKYNYCYSDGTTYVGGVRRMFIDMQGYVEVGTEFNEVTKRDEKVILTNRPQEVTEFVYEFAEIEGQIEEKERIYACRGHEHLTNDVPYIATDMRVEVGARKEKRRLKFLKLNSTSLKLTVMAYLNRAVAKANGEEIDKEDTKTISFAKDYADDFGGDLDKEHLFNQVTSEEYGYNEKGKQGFTRIKKDNHYFDCLAMIETGAVMDKVDQLEVPDREDEITTSDLFGV